MCTLYSHVKFAIGCCLLIPALAGAGETAPPAGAGARLERVPNDGIQPQVAVGADGTAHLIYFSGDASAGDVFYCRRRQGESEFSVPIRINSEPGSVIATGSIRGAQLALGKDDRPHVAWNGSSRAKPRGPEGQTPLLYSRLRDDGIRFEPQRNVIRAAYGLDGGACLAADTKGRILIAWHAGEGRDEAQRRVWMTRSADDGRTFSHERVIDETPVGACGCCGMRGSVGPDGVVRFLYRAARDEVHRDMSLLTSVDGGESFTSRQLDEWELSTCPMSSEALAHTKEATWAAWETADQIILANLSADSREARAQQSPPGAPDRRKQPALAVDGEGRLLLVWTEGTGWNRGGRLAWQVFDRGGRPVEAEQGQAPGIPVWSFAAAYAERDGSFVILY